jgi:sulfate adenylyltransferase
VPENSSLQLKHRHSVVANLRLADGTLFPIPITLDVSQAEIDTLGLKPNVRLALLDPRDDQALAIITIEDIYTFDKAKEAAHVFGADDSAHPAVAYLHKRVKQFYVGGKVQAIQLPNHFDYVALRCTDVLSLGFHLGLTILFEQSLPPSFVLISKNSLGARSSLSKPGTPCTVHTEN